MPRPVLAINDNLTAIRRRIREHARRAGRDPDDIELIAVSKTRSLEEVMQAVAAGQRDFGENTLQDAMSKIPYVNRPGVRWHFIGRLQSKKARQIPGRFQWVHSVDSLKLARRLSSAMQDSAVTDRLECLLQVNVTREASKSGVLPDQLRPLLHDLLAQDLPGLNWRGLMTIGVQGDEVRTRQAFALLREFQQQCRDEFTLPAFDQLSMGMSDDYAVAIEQGATMLRLGTALFGQRRTTPVR